MMMYRRCNYGYSKPEVDRREMRSLTTKVSTGNATPAEQLQLRMIQRAIKSGKVSA